MAMSGLRLWDPNECHVPDGALLPGLRLPPALRADLATLQEHCWDEPLTVPPDGLCLLYCYLAALDPEGWQFVERDTLGFIVDQQQEMILKERAAKLLQQVVACMRDSGATAGAERLERGGYPGHEDLEHYARTFGVAFLVSPDDAEAFS